MKTIHQRAERIDALYENVRREKDLLRQPLTMQRNIDPGETARVAEHLVFAANKLAENARKIARDCLIIAAEQKSNKAQHITEKETK